MSNQDKGVLLLIVCNAGLLTLVTQNFVVALILAAMAWFFYAAGRNIP